WDDYATAASFGDRIVARAVTAKTMPPASSGIPMLDAEQQAAMLAWQAAGFPATAASNVSDANFNYTNLELTLPVVIVGNGSYQAKLRFVPMASSPTGIGFELFSASQTTATSSKAATYNPATGAVTLPEVQLSNSPNQLPSNRISAQLTVVPGAGGLQRFALSSFTFLSQ